MDLISTKITLKRQSYHPMETLFYWPKGVVAVLTNAKAYYSYLADFLICMGKHPKNRWTDFWKRYKHDQEGATITTFFTDCSFSSGNVSLLSFSERQKMDGNDYTRTSSLAQANNNNNNNNIIIIIVFISTQDKKYISYVTIFE